jgi:LDH2 family malate/lactate/ureidoglycolate dehydrogenase
MREDRAQDVPKRFSAYSPLKDSILGLMAEKQSTERRFQSRDLESFVARALIAVGLPASDADQVAQLMILADLRGSDGHGIFRLPQYIRRIRAGGMNLRPNIHIVQETDATALVDGDNGIGHLVMRFATRVAMEKAGRSVSVGSAYKGATTRVRQRFTR